MFGFKPHIPRSVLFTHTCKDKPERTQTCNEKIKLETGCKLVSWILYLHSLVFVSVCNYKLRTVASKKVCVECSTFLVLRFYPDRAVNLLNLKFKVATFVCSSYRSENVVHNCE